MVPALLGLKGNLEMTLASRLSTAVSWDNREGGVHLLGEGGLLTATMGCCIEGLEILGNIFLIQFIPALLSLDMYWTALLSTVCV